MGFCFGSRKKSDILVDNRETILANSQAIAACANLCEDEELKKEITRLKDKAYFFTPTSNLNAIQIDKKIANLAGDLKIAVSRGSIERVRVESAEVLKKLDALCEDRINATNM